MSAQVRRPLDFFVIGAMKAGTTSLYYELRKHPQIYLPAEKEIPFFAIDSLYERGLDWYLREFFSRATSGQRTGTVTPQYMLYRHVPERMHAAFPEARLIAVLRDPLERIRSHYKMMVRAFGEKRSFREVLQGHYVEGGEYGRMLEDYLRYFPRDRLLVLFSGDLERSHSAVLARIYAFLGVSGIVAATPPERRNTAEAANSRRFARFAANAAHSYVRPLRPLIKRLLPERYTRRVALWSIMYRSKVADPAGIDVSLPAGQERELARHYLADLDRLESIVERPMPWRGRLMTLAHGG
jgi:Sulfotransferase domain